MADDEFDHEKHAAEYRRWQHKLTEQQYARRIQRYAAVPTAIEFYGAVTVDDHGTAWLGEWDGYVIQIQDMGMRDRLVMTPIVSPYIYDYGWDFPRGEAAVLAALAWDPQQQAEPEGFVRRIGRKRLAGERAPTHVPEGVKAAARMLGLNPD